MYELLYQYKKLGLLLSTELNANEALADTSELYKLTLRKSLYNEEALGAATALAKSMDLQLKGIEEVDATGHPLQEIPKVSELNLASFFKHTRPTFDDFLHCIKDADGSYRSKYIVVGSFVQSLAVDGTEPTKLAPHKADPVPAEVFVHL